MADQILLKTMLGRSSSFFLPLTFLAACLAIAPCAGAAEAYHGTVIDAETKKPLEGAVVVVVWYRKPMVHMDGPQYFHNAIEVLTDAEGEFSVSADPGIDWNPLTFVLKQPRIVIFKPGYGPFPVAHISPPPRVIRDGQETALNWNDELLKRAVVELPRLKAKADLEWYASPGVVVGTTCRPRYPAGQCIPLERVPNLIRLINIHRSKLGLESLPTSSEEGGAP